MKSSEHQLDAIFPQQQEGSGGVAVESKIDSRALSEQQYRKEFRSPHEEILENREKESSEDLGGGINETRFVKLKDDGAGIFKPKSGESRIGGKEKPAGTLYKRERAAYLVSRFLQFDFVPETTIREIDGEIGSLQRFITDAKEGECIDDLGPLSESARKKMSEDRQRMRLFDYIIWNTDRHDGNYLVNEKGEITAIDHGFSFGSPHHARYYKGVIPADTETKLKSFALSEHLRQIFIDLLSELLSEKEVKACLKRIDHLLSLIDAGKFTDSGEVELS